MNVCWSALAWGVALILGFVGWGRLLARFLAPQARVGWGQCAAWGLAVSVIVGGVLNWLSAISRPLLVGYVAAGVALTVWDAGRACFAPRDRRRPGLASFAADPLSACLLIVLVALVGFRFVAAPVQRSFSPNSTSPDFYGVTFNPHDDLHAYLVFPERMLQTGHLGDDPFNTRRLETSLGGTHFLNALTLAALPVDQLHLFENGVCIVILCGITAELFGALGVSRRANRFLLIVGQCMIMDTFNVVSHVSAMVMLTAWMLLLVEARWRTDPPLRSALLLGIVFAGTAALKSTVLVMAGLLIVVYLLIQAFTRPDRRLLLVIGVAGAVTILALAPWMDAMVRSSGTLLYPFLGNGYHWTRYLSAPLPAEPVSRWILENNLRALWLPGVWAVGLGLVFIAGRAVWAVRGLGNVWSVAAAAVTAWLVSIVGFAWAGGGWAVYRYVFPIEYVSGLLLLGAVWRLTHSRAGSRLLRLPQPWYWRALAAGWLVLQLPMALNLYARILPDDLRPGGPRWPVTDASVNRSVARMQQAVPAGARLLVRLTQPYLLDFQRNPIFVADWPGSVSPPPGMPLGRGPEPLARYLLGRGIRYVAYSYRLQADYPEAYFGWMAGPDQPPWDRYQARFAFDFQSNLAALGKTRRHLYDDGSTFVLDLAATLPTESMQSGR